MERLINRRQQGDLGEASAIDWLTRVGAGVLIPFGHSPDYDLIADFEGRLLRVQVKTSVWRTEPPNGFPRYGVQLATLGGNQSWTGRVKTFDADLVDALFALTGDGRRWFIPAGEVESKSSVTLGGPKYSEFEIESSQPIEKLVYGVDSQPIQSNTARGSFGVGEPSEPVKFVAKPEWVRIPPPPLSSSLGSVPPVGECVTEVPRGTAPRGQTRVSGNRQIVIPKRAFETAELARGDRLKAYANGPGEIVFRRLTRERNDTEPR